MPRGKTFKAEQIIRKLRGAEVRLAQGKTVPEAVRKLGVTERPDLFAAAHSGVGCTDMLCSETTTNGPPNIPEFGAVTEEDGFRGLLAMSTLHQIRDGVAYPEVLLTHGINDPRVAPWQSAKGAARFQEATSSGKPVLLRIDNHADHGLSSTQPQRQEELADSWSFFLWQCGDPDFQPTCGDDE